MKWVVAFDDAFKAEFNALPEAVQDEMLAQVEVIRAFGPQAGRASIR